MLMLPADSPTELLIGIDDRAIFPELLALTGDRGARPVIARDPGRVEWVRVERPMPPDVDTPADYEKIRSAIRPQSRGVD